ncbi:hypothetical protein [Lyngbya sp. CCY1209]|uniref:hypothetical protein n=1 Tax=Lyngbya sp. CCY1209 TaxID=2886103 RepID=UPI002D1FD136|nr:hypothetical protein [Lyngbya sp. CCY1209]MEB3886859.1 hypothetical protein [Lyngbya sp. CCY1209]
MANFRNFTGVDDVEFVRKNTDKLTVAMYSAFREFTVKTPRVRSLFYTGLMAKNQEFHGEVPLSRSRPNSHMAGVGAVSAGICKGTKTGPG